MSIFDRYIPPQLLNTPTYTAPDGTVITAPPRLPGQPPLAKVVPPSKSRVPEQPATLPYRPNMGNFLLGLGAGFLNTSRDIEQAKYERAMAAQEMSLKERQVATGEKSAATQAKGVEADIAHQKRSDALAVAKAASDTYDKYIQNGGTPDMSVMLGIHKYMSGETGLDDPNIKAWLSKASPTLPQDMQDRISMYALSGMDPSEARVKAAQEGIAAMKDKDSLLKFQLKNAELTYDYTKGKIEGTLPLSNEEGIALLGHTNSSIGNLMNAAASIIGDLSRGGGNAAAANQLLAGILSGATPGANDMASLKQAQMQGATNPEVSKAWKSLEQIGVQLDQLTGIRNAAYKKLGYEIAAPTTTTNAPPPDTGPKLPGKPVVVTSAPEPSWLQSMSDTRALRWTKPILAGIGAVGDTAARLMGRDEAGISSKYSAQVAAGILDNGDVTDTFLTKLGLTPEQYQAERDQVLSQGLSMDEVRLKFLHDALVKDGSAAALTAAKKIEQTFYEMQRGLRPPDGTAYSGNLPPNQ